MTIYTDDKDLIQKHANGPNVIKPGQKLNSRMLQCRNSDQIFKLLPGVQVLSKYNPPQNGWCGYSAVYYALCCANETLANERGLVVKLSLLKHLKSNPKMKDMQVTLNKLEQLSSADLKTTNWWFELPECLQVACDFYKKSCIYFTKDSMMPVVINYNDALPKAALFFANEHFIAYEIELNELPDPIDCIMIKIN